MDELLLIHLSDIHFRTGASEELATRGKLVVAALEESLPAEGEVGFVITGDIANTGRTDEYSLALDFVSDLIGETQTRRPQVKTFLAMSPGNHDCNFDLDSIMRQMALKQLTSSDAIVSGVDGSVIDVCTATQAPFFTFFEALTQFVPSNKVCWEQRMENADVRLISLNSAWTSQKREQQGSLRLPINLLPGSEPCALTIAICHHPLNWLESNNARELRRHIEETSDLFLTGHEHATEQYVKQMRQGGVFVSAAAAFDDGTESRFTTYRVKVAEHSIATTLFAFDARTGRYAQQGEIETFQYQPARSRAHGFLRLSQAFESQLNDAGTRFTHPRAKSLVLDDIFVSPELEERLSERSGTAKPQLINLEKNAAYLGKHRYLLLVGDPASGKTALAKRLFRDLHQAGIGPVLLNGSRLPRDAELFAEHIRSEVSSQYRKEDVEGVLQLPPDKKALIVDDLHLLKGGPGNREAFLKWSKARFGTVILMADDALIAGQIASGESSTAILAFRQLGIAEFGRRLRGRLIETWCRLGISGEEPEDLDALISERERAIDTLLGKNMLPSYPLFVLTLLQTIEAGTSHRLTSGAFGHIYETLITQSILRVAPQLPPDAKIAFASAVAYRVFTSDQEAVSLGDIEAVASDYRNRFRLALDTERTIAALVEADILKLVGDGYVFKYPYAYYFFAAKYMQEGLRQSVVEADVRARIEELAASLHHEHSANILVFLLYLTKDEALILRLLEYAKTIYQQHTPARLEEDAKRLGRATELQFEISGAKPHAERERFRAQQDRAEREMRDLEQEAETVDEVVRLNVAFKTIQIMGQILRNFPGSLEGDAKENLVSECYNLGLRTLQAVLTLVNETSRDEMIEFFASYAKRKHPGLSNPEIRQRAESLLFILNFGVSHSVIKRLSFSAGSRHLIETYKDVAYRENASVAIRLIDIAVRFDHIRPLPITEAIRLHHSLRKNNNLFADMLLKQIASEHLRLFSVKHNERQQISEELELAQSTRKYQLPARGK